MSRANNAACLMLLTMTPLFAADRQSAGNKSSSDQEKNSIAKERGDPARQKILSVLDRLIKTQATIADENFRALLQAQIADILWSFDEAGARRLFEAAFKTIADANPFERSSHNPVRDVLAQTIVRRSPILAAKLAQSLTDQSVTSASQNSERAALQYQTAFYLSMQNPLLAAQVAKPLAEAGDLIKIIPLLRQIRVREPQAADELFIKAFEKGTLEQPNLDAIRWSASYLFPRFGEGVISFPSDPGLHDVYKPIPIGRAVIDQFLDLAYNAISRRLDAALSNEGARLDARSLLDYAVPKLLASYFDRFMPDKAPAFRARLQDALRRVPPEDQPYLALTEPCTSQELITRADALKDIRQKDFFYSRAATLAISSGNFDQTPAIIEKIVNESVRSNALEMLRRRTTNNHFDDITKAISANDFDSAEKMITGISDPRLHQWLFSSLIAATFRRDKARAMRTLDQAERLASSVETPMERARALMMLAGATARVDAGRAFEKMEMAIAELNRAGLAAEWEKYQEVEATGGGEKDNSSRKISMGAGFMLNDPDFQSLGGENFDRALILAQQVQVQTASALAQLAVCRGALAKLQPQQPVRPAANEK